MVDSDAGQRANDGIRDSRSVERIRVADGKKQAGDTDQ